MNYVWRWIRDATVDRDRWHSAHSDREGFSKYMKMFFGLLGIWMFIVVLLIGIAWPVVPHTLKGWFLFLTIGPVLYIAWEALMEWVWSTRLAQALKNHPSKTLRITVLVILGCASLILIAWGASFVSSLHLI